MIHELPEPIEGFTHVRPTKRQDHPGSGLVLSYQLGTADADGGFVPSRVVKEQRKTVPKPVVDQMRERAADGGAPTTDGEQEYRWADVLAIMDAEGLW